MTVINNIDGFVHTIVDCLPWREAAQAVVKRLTLVAMTKKTCPFAAPTVQDGSRPGIAPGRTELVPTQSTPQAKALGTA